MAARAQYGKQRQALRQQTALTAHEKPHKTAKKRTEIRGKRHRTTSAR